MYHRLQAPPAQAWETGHQQAQSRGVGGLTEKNMPTNTS